MPRRATSTSFGGKQGNTPKGKNPRRPGPGRPPEAFYTRLATILEREKTTSNIAKVLNSPSHKHFARVLEYASDRAFGKPTQVHDIEPGGSLEEILSRSWIVDPESTR